VKLTVIVATEIRAWSAAPPEEPQSALGHRQIKSASSAPNDPFFFPMARAKSPVSASIPGVGGRGRSIRLQKIGQRDGSLSHKSSHSTTSAVDPISTEQSNPYQATQPFYSAGFGLSSIMLPKLRAPYSATTLRGPFSSTSSLDEDYFEIQGPRRAVTAPEAQSQTHSLHRRAFSHESGLKGASSALHRVCAEEVVVPPSFDIPDSITEIDESSPPRVVQRRELVHDNSSLNITESRPETAVPSGKPDVNKALPELPSYLVPSPLFSHSFADPSEQAKGLFLDLDFKQSRFSAWTEDLNGSDIEDSDIELGDGRSSTFSSVWDSGHTSPLRFSDPFYTSLGPVSDDGGKRTSTRDPDAADHPRDSGMALEDDEKQADLVTKQMTQMEQLLDEFEYLGAALL
jgi:hypothetical protein